MPDQIFENSRLVEIYDAFDGQRRDLDHYISIARELKAKSILDIGCGTGCFACRLSNEGFTVTAIDPAQSSLEFARRKPNAEQVHWILGDATSAPPMSVDLAVMTGNVAQVFLTDEAWDKTLTAIRQRLHRKGHFVFEVRDPARKAWLEWTRKKTYTHINISNIGNVEGCCEVTNISDQLVSFRWTYVFKSDGAVLSSDSTLRFRERGEIEHSLQRAGYAIKEIRDAPDRPGKEFVFIASPSA